MKLLSSSAVLLLGALLSSADALLAEGPLRSTQLRHDRPVFVQHKNKTFGDPAWTSTGPDSTDFNDETETDYLACTVETFFATCYCLLIASAPILLAALAEQQLTRAHMLESVALVVWLGSAIFMFTEVLKFQSLHWTGVRPLTLVEAVYLLSQILTTVGYGDITPAFPRGQVWVGINVIIGLCLYGSIIMEVVGIVHERVTKAIGSISVESDPSRRLGNWMTASHADTKKVSQSAVFFGSCATVGILFWHFYPGEGKTWLQAIYMSIITLSTVGFGAFNATTEAGKIFGAFWMLIGVASLGALVTSFIETMTLEKQIQKHECADDCQDFDRILAKCSANGKVDRLQFLKFGLMMTKGTDVKKFEKFEARFKKLSTKVGKDEYIRRTRIVDEEGPLLVPREELQQ